MSAPSPTTEQGWDQATFSCGRCGAKRTVTTEADYLKAVGVHRDAHAVFDRLNQIERDGFASILRVILADAELGREFLALMDLQQPTSPNPNTQEGTAP
ncbi:hypothetical protein OG819_55210 [Streptomyces sp. NBC_01549]|uniref:hypothetical protein n=1 Tax=Streptomyces sp. NBC_01549 TaxID=2975874 RepID=UPI00225C2195|nr:hypothetical protein [Streptomyces sp. NBC_01549]MCX4598308.1 hypothetical protein [Streptomyces sp. NBC_01549]